MPRILLSNDDGINALGLKRLLKEIAKLGRIFVVAPDRERSTVSHALTLSRPLRINKTGEDSYSIDGTPSDCVVIAIKRLLKETPPDLVISGINHGANLGDDVIYSGTVAAAMEGTMLGIPSIAVSLVGEKFNDESFSNAVKFTCQIAKNILKNGLPKGTFLNVNIPSSFKENIENHAMVRMGKRSYSTQIEEKLDPRGKKYYWIGGNSNGFLNIADSDCNAIEQGKISITPLKTDLTDYKYLEENKNTHM